MRQKKSNIIYYAAAIIVLAIVAFITFTEIPVDVEHVEEIVNQ